MTVAWRFVPFGALSTTELYEVLQLRTEVFVMEQAGIYQDMDGADHAAVHVLGASGDQLVAYARCFPAGVKFAEASIGRVIIRETMRGSGIGHELMRQAIACVFAQWGAQPIRIGAQARLEMFYLQHGFAKAGEPYIEDGIPHIEMLRPISFQGAKHDQ
ncbi:MAG: GNAT family N-acetyltransferase [Polaromonas sp.]|uniref:GNAT family N-acetyltransferase n=1 Tax=Polaromonas sp. TaxID=1869339 RepID=UPI0024875C5E|nr:GNAT family N-acetyltransferase [Polaromonas sp.]MDI1238221.1 GNAT family N-acetyltransferase [Polaromonas sp.]